MTIPPVMVAWAERWSSRSIDLEGPGAPRAPDILAASLEALQAALVRPGRDREAAEALLAADALLTLAVEQACDLPDPEGALLDLLRRLGRAASEGTG